MLKFTCFFSHAIPKAVSSDPTCAILFFSAASRPCMYHLFWLATGYIFKHTQEPIKCKSFWLNWVYCGWILKLLLVTVFFIFASLPHVFSWCLIKIMQHTYIHFLTIFFFWPLARLWSIDWVLDPATNSDQVVVKQGFGTSI